MNRTRLAILQASIVASGIVLAGFLNGGIYVMERNWGNTIARLNRFTGDVDMCVLGHSCGFEIEPSNVLGDDLNSTLPEPVDDEDEAPS